MPKPQTESNSWEQQDRSSRRLRQSLEKLERNSSQYLTKKYGISENFVQEVKSKEQALQLCEKAMEALATEYVDHLSTFKESTDPKVALAALEQAEVVWRAEASLIANLDAAGREHQFLGTMRGQAFQVVQDKLEDAARSCAKQPTPENAALCLGVIGVVDTMLAELGLPPNSAERKKFREIAKGLL